jgi:hypothetical protein
MVGEEGAEYRTHLNNMLVSSLTECNNIDLVIGNLDDHPANRRENNVANDY